MPAASSRRLASCATALPRSAVLIPRSFTESSAMLSWRGVVAGGAGLGGFPMMLLLDDVRIALGASSETTLDQQLVQVSECRHRHTRWAKLHPDTSNGVEHPRRHDRDHARRHLDVHEVASETILAVMPSQAPPMQRVPAVVNDNLLPDMGRMTG